MDRDSEIRRLIAYDPLTGILTWRVDRYRVKAGDAAGSVQPTGYLAICVCQRKYLAHRLAWFLTHGEWPVATIDHADLNPLNNRLSNLRPATQSSQTANQGLRASNTSGLKGASFIPSTGKWRATITKNYQSINLGHFDTAEAAHQAYLIAAKSLFGEFARAA